MRHYTTEHTVYNFDELDKSSQEYAIEKYQEDMDYYGLEDEMDYILEGLLKKNKITYDELPKVYYSFSYCQGDGAMFQGTVYWKSWTADIKQSGNYYHFNSKLIDLYSTKTGNYPKDAVYEQFNALYVDICRDLERAGYKYIEDMRSDEAIADHLQANKYEFYASGEVA